MKKFMIRIFILGMAMVSVAQAAGDFLYVPNPDQFASRNIERYLPNESDTGRYELDECRRLTSKVDRVRIVCTGRVQVLVHGGHAAWKSIACLQTFKLNRNIGKYLTTRYPTCK